MKLDKKRDKIFIALSVAAVTAAVLVLFMRGQETPQKITELKRPDYGEDNYTYNFHALYDNEDYAVEFPVSAKKLSGTELQAAFDSAYEFIIDKMRGDNPSLDEVRDNLVFADSIPQYGMKADYTLNDYSVISCFGEVNNSGVAPGGQKYIVSARISYEMLSQDYEIPVTVLPPVYGEEQIKINKIVSELEKADRADPETDMKLPESVDGLEIAFVKHPENRVWIILFPLLAAFVFWYYKRFVLKKRTEDERESQLRLDYPEIVSKLSLLMGAGMSGANAFAKISRDYADAKRERKQSVRRGYEAVAAASGRIAAGVSEPEAYAEFGRACRLHSYIKLASLLTQNVIKGSEGFKLMLRGEVTEAFAERKALARTKGEEAGTKLLMPMVMMLGIVLVIIVVPAFMSF